MFCIETIARGKYIKIKLSLCHNPSLEGIPSILQRNKEKQNSRGKNHGSYSNSLYRLVQTNSDLLTIIRQRVRPGQQAVQLLV